ncbi:UDP-glucoronosyl and UDP-glucosyl transferase [Trichuris suis]|nr:UDP-glucoronosyl and UDP-glucosyl transferase [Trichuris suis]
MRYAITITAVLAISFPMMRTATAKSILFMPAMAGASPSHVKSMIPLAENLLKDGHNVSMVQYYNEDREKVTHDTIHFIYMLISGRKLIDEEQQSTIWGTRGKDPWMIVKIASRASAACLRSMHTEGQKQFYKKLSAFNWDLLIVDNLFQPCGIIFSTNTKGQAWIDYSTTLLLKYVRRFRAVSVPPSVDLSPLVMEVFQPTIFKNRFLTSIELVLEYAVSFGLAVAMTTPWRGEGAMFSTNHVSNFHTNAVYSLASLSSKLDIALPQSMNTFSMDYACPKAAKLSREYQNFVEDPSSNGTIVFSFGHIADWKEAPIELIKAVSSAFESLSQYRIVWQFNGNVSTVSSSRHLRIEPWIPLPSLLQHPKTVLFITHSGMKSFREAICFTVPMVSIPLFGDQVRNTILTKFHGLGVSLDKTQLTEESLYKTILNVLHDGGYKRRITKLSAMLSDNLMDETAKGSFWISFYLRHPKSASHMRLKGATMTSVSYHSYDILTFICVLLFAFHCSIHS